MKNTYRNGGVGRAFGRPLVTALSAALWLLASGSWLAVGTGVMGTGPTAQAAPARHVPVSRGPQPAGQKVSARPPARPGLSISITDGHRSVARGDHLRYVVMVKNAGAATARNLRVTLTLPPYLSVGSAGRRAAKAGKVTWRASLRPGHTASFTATAVVGKTPRGMGHLAVVACAETHSGRPVVCAAHLDRLPGAAGATSSTSGTAPGTANGSSGSAASAGPSGGLSRYVFTGLAVLACIAAAALTARRLRGRKQPGHAR